MAKMTYAVIIRNAGANYSVEIPDLPGCVTTGSTVDEAIENIKEAIALHLEGLKKEGYDIPFPQRTISAIVEDDSETLYTTIEIAA